MSLIKKIIYSILIINIAYYGYIIYQKGYKFDADDPDKSIRIMLRLTDPLERGIFLKKFEAACEGRRCVNLHGLTKEEIYKTVKEKQK